MGWGRGVEWVFLTQPHKKSSLNTAAAALGVESLTCLPLFLSGKRRRIKCWKP